MRPGRKIAALGVTAAALAGSCIAASELRSPEPAQAAPAKYVDALLSLHHAKGIHRFARSVSDPRSPDYGEYQSVTRLVKRFGASPKAKKRTMRWFAANGIEGRIGRTGTFATARIPAGAAGRLLGDRAAAATAAAGGAARVPVPSELRRDVEKITLLSAEPVAQAAATPPAQAAKGPPSSYTVRTGTPRGCPAGRNAVIPGEDPAEAGFTPNQYLKAYGHRALHKRGSRGQGARVAVVEIDGFARSDLEVFGRCFGIRVPPTPVHLVGVPADLAPGLETTLDLELLAATAPALKRIDVYQGGRAAAQIVETAAAALGPRGGHPQAISISLVICELELLDQPAIYQTGDEVFGIAAGAGISVLAGAGDWGSTGCTGAGGVVPALSTAYPATSPWVTGVGGTNLHLDRRNGIVKERVWNDVPRELRGGGGGTSVIEKAPFYQRGDRFSRATKRRLSPDIAALADLVPGYAIYCTAQSGCNGLGWLPVGGTSVATPLNAGGVVLANKLLRRESRPRLGALNPMIYDLARHPADRRRVFNDVVLGNNNLSALLPPGPGGEAAVSCCTALRGYDRASGWGSIGFPAFLRAAAARG